MSLNYSNKMITLIYNAFFAYHASRWLSIGPDHINVSVEHSLMQLNVQ